MATFMARVELHDAIYQDYVNLHSHMTQEGFTNTIRSDVQPDRQPHARAGHRKGHSRRAEDDEAFRRVDVGIYWLHVGRSGASAAACVGLYLLIAVRCTAEWWHTHIRRAGHHAAIAVRT